MKFSRSTAAAAWVVLGLAAIAGAHAGERPQCPQLFAGGKPPALTRSTLEQRTTMICNQAYAVLASGISKGPLWSAERLTGESVRAGERHRPVAEFHPDPHVPAPDRAELQDYTGSGYDRGHMTPSGDPATEQAKIETYALSNIVPQAAALNRGVWEAIEEATRDLAISDGEIFVVTGPAFHGTEIAFIGPDKVLVPTATWKAIYDPKLKQTGVYVCKNDEAHQCRIHTVDDLIRETGIDPFPAVPDSEKATAMDLPRPERSRYSRNNQ
jgi:endonuclease G